MEGYSSTQEKLLHIKLAISVVLILLFLVIAAITGTLLGEFPVWFIGFCVLWIVYASLKSANYFLPDPEDNNNNSDTSS